MSDHEELESSVAAWVLGALEAGEADLVRTHIEECASCRETVMRLTRAIGALPLDVAEITPPAGLRERILIAAAASPDTATATARTRFDTKEPRRTLGPTNLSSHRPSTMAVFAAVAAVVLALVVGLAAGALIGRGTTASPAVVRSALVGHQGLAGARASVINLKGDGVALVDFSGLPQLDPGRVYEVWLITAAGRADPAGVFVPDSNGSKFVLVSKSLAGYTQMAITSEVGPSGAPAPTQNPELYGNLT
jgi:anti-sigma-K factor RskA